MNITQKDIDLALSVIVKSFSEYAGILNKEFLYRDYRRCHNQVSGIELLIGECDKTKSAMAELEAHYNQLKLQLAA